MPSLGLIALLASVAFAAGMIDSIAGGGGLFTLPALLAAGLPPHIALGTNKGQSVFGAIASFVAYLRAGKIDRTRLPAGLVFGFLGSIVGALLLLAIRPEPLRPIILILLALGAIVVAFRERVQHATTRAPLTRPLPAASVVALMFGAYDGFFGPGVGAMLIVACVLVFGDSLTSASANAKVVNLASNVAACGLFALRGNVIWRLAIPMAIGNAIGASIGARIALRRGDRFVRIVVLVVVALIIVKLARDLVR